MASPLSGRFRANIESDQVAYVGTESFDANQFLPAGTKEYQVYGAQQLSRSERWPGGPSEITYTFKVPVGTSKADIQAKAGQQIADTIAAQKAFSSDRGAWGGTSDYYFAG